MKTNRQECITNARRAVIKVGSGLLTGKDGLNVKLLKSVAGQISRLIDNGTEIILVSSGAMAAGIKKIGLAQRPREIPKRQAVAAVGQAGLMHAWEMAFNTFDRKVAQILLTGDGLTERKRYLNARNTICTLLSWKVIPVINENDTVSIREIQFGDNDNLAAIITLLMDADILINLSDIDGLYDEDPRENPKAALIPVVSKITQGIEKKAGAIPGELGTGGMMSKIKAARKTTSAGIPMIIARGSMPDILVRLFGGEDLGTFFVPVRPRLCQRKSWIANNLKPAGQIHIDGGAEQAIRKKGKSLLPSGVIDIVGDFDIGAAVTCVSAEGHPIGVGLVNYGASDIRKIMGLRTSEIESRLGAKPYDEVIHRDNFVVTASDAEA